MQRPLPQPPELEEDPDPYGYVLEGKIYKAFCKQSIRFYSIFGNDGNFWSTFSYRDKLVWNDGISFVWLRKIFSTFFCKDIVSKRVIGASCEKSSGYYTES